MAGLFVLSASRCWVGAGNDLARGFADGLYGPVYDGAVSFTIDSGHRADMPAGPKGAQADIEPYSGSTRICRIESRVAHLDESSPRSGWPAPPIWSNLVFGRDRHIAC